MRYISFIIFALSISVQAQEAWSDKTRVLPDALRKIQVAILITHSPNPIYPEKTDDENTSAKYVWKHSTTILSPHRDLTIMEAGSFIWYDATGWKKNVEYDKRTFEKTFNCKSGLLKAGKAYTYQENYRWGNQLYGGDALWYVLAADNEGTLYKGIGLIETESTLQKTKP